MRAVGLTLYCLVLIAALTLSPLLAEGLVVERFEGDVWHLLDATERVVLGQWPHLDFMTPLGVLAFLPVAAMRWAGAGLGDAVILAQAMVAATLTVGLVRVSASRLTGALAWAYPTLVILLVMALTHPVANGATTFAMYYNRWAWSVVAVVLPLSILPAVRGKSFDGLLIGLGLSALVLLKITYFAALVPAIAAALVLRSAWTTGLAAVITGLVVFLAARAAIGADFWPEYSSDLQEVARSAFRPSRGLSFSEAALLPLSVIGLGGSLFAGGLLWLSGRRRAAVSLLLSLPGLVFISYSNFGAMAFWTLPVAGVVLALDAGRAVRAAGLVMAVAVLPVFWPLAESIYRAAAPDLQSAERMIPKGDLYTLRERGGLTETDGETCRVLGSFTRWYADLALLLAENGVAPDEGVFVSDVLSGVWLLGVSAPLGGGAPWNYGSAQSAQAANYVLEPKCVARPDLQKASQDGARAVLRDAQVETIADTDVGTLYRIVR